MCDNAATTNAIIVRKRGNLDGKLIVRPIVATTSATQTATGIRERDIVGKLAGGKGIHISTSNEKER